jgi:RNA polymerase sigma-70 factor, ECF subfamily
MVPGAKVERTPASADGTGPSGLQDLALVAAARLGDGAAVATLLERMQCVPRFVRAIASRLGRTLSREEQEDLTQDVLAVVWRKLAEFRGEAALATWMFRICDLTARNAFRRADRRRAPSLEEVADPRSRNRTDDDEAMLAALDRLPPDEAAILRLKHFDGLTFDAIGTNLGLSSNTVKTRYYRGLSTLREWLRRAEADR